MSKKPYLALEAGRYENFTGVIMWGENESVVENATFDFEEYPTLKLITFHSGVWKDGIWWGGTWERGLWEYGTWRGGTWEDGTWKSGRWKDGKWEGGKWKRGKDNSGVGHLDSPDNWKK